MSEPRKVVIRNLVPLKEEDKQPSITCLTRDPMLVLASHLPFNALTELSTTCTGFFHFTRISIDARKSLLSAVMAANIERVRACLADPLNVSMILRRLSAREFNQREWDSVSPLEFAAWAGDQQLVTLLLQHVPQEDKPEAIRHLEKVVITGLQHGFPLIKYYELAETYKIYTIYYANDIRLEAEPFCIKSFGSKQAKLPSFCLKHFCGSEIFYKEALDEYKNLGNSRYINKSDVSTHISRFPTHAEAATHCELYIMNYVGRHQLFLTHLIDRLRLELPVAQPNPKKPRRS